MATTQQLFEEDLHIDCLQFSSVSPSSFLLSSSALTGQYWTGKLSLHSLQIATSPSTSLLSSIELDSGCREFTQLKVGNQYFVLVGLDSSSVLAYSLNADSLTDTTHRWSSHTGAVWSISGSPNDSFFVTGSADKTIKLWKFEEEHAIRTFKGHKNTVTRVDWSGEPNVFASVSLDHQLIVWDSRTDKATASASHSLSSIYALSWSQKNHSLLALGNSSGEIFIYDSRKSFKEPVHRFEAVHNGDISSLKWARNSESRIATSSEDCSLTVFDIESSSVFYRSKVHKDFVQTIAWHPTDENVLLSGSWDKSIQLHVLNKKN